MHLCTFNPIGVKITLILIQINFFNLKNRHSVTDQSNPAAKLLSIAGAISLAALMMHLSAWDFLQINQETSMNLQNKLS